MTGKKVMQLIGTNEMRCRICGSKHFAQIKPDSKGKFYRGSWQCQNGCKLEKEKEQEIKIPASNSCEAERKMKCLNCGKECNSKDGFCSLKCHEEALEPCINCGKPTFNVVCSDKYLKEQMTEPCLSCGKPTDLIFCSDKCREEQEKLNDRCDYFLIDEKIRKKFERNKNGLTDRQIKNFVIKYKKERQEK